MSPADENFINIYRIKLVAGRNIQLSDTGVNIIINNTYAKILGFDKPHDAIGKQLGGFNGGFNGRPKLINIVGVVADYNQRSLHSPIYPSVIVAARSNRFHTLQIRLKPETAGGNEWKTVIASIGKAWKKVYPDDDFNYDFFDETIARFYEEEQHTSTLLTCATGFSILISCLGLLGLAVYTTNQRRKEIGVRKVFGASVIQIVNLLSTELVTLILLSIIIVTPLAWMAMNKWIQNYAYRTPVSWWIFAVSGGGMLLAAVFTSIFQTVKAATANPVKSLRSE